MAELSVTAATSSASSSSSLRLPIPAFPPQIVTPPGSNGPVQAAGPPADYHSESAESMDEIPVAQTRLGSSAPNGASKSHPSGTQHFLFPASPSQGGGEKRQNAGHKVKRQNCPPSAQPQEEEELELSFKVPTVFVSTSSGEPPVPDSSWPGESSEPSHRKCSSKRHMDDQDFHLWDTSTSTTAA